MWRNSNMFKIKRLLSYNDDFRQNYRWLDFGDHLQERKSFSFSWRQQSPSLYNKKFVVVTESTFDNYSCLFVRQPTLTLSNNFHVTPYHPSYHSNKITTSERRTCLLFIWVVLTRISVVPVMMDALNFRFHCSILDKYCNEGKPVVEGTRFIDTETTTSWIPIHSLLRANWLVTLLNTYKYSSMTRDVGVASAMVRPDERPGRWSVVLSRLPGRRLPIPAQVHRYVLLISHCLRFILSILYWSWWRTFPTKAY